MSAQATKIVAKAAWITLIVYVLARRLVGTVIGQGPADLLVFVFSVLAIPLALYCLWRMREHGTRGILGNSIGTLVVAGLLLAIWIPNFLAARERSRAARQAKESALQVHITRDGAILMNGKPATIHALKAELQRVAAAGGSMQYSRDDPTKDPHTNAMVVMQAAVESNISIQMAMPE